MGGELPYPGLIWRISKGDAVASMDILSVGYSVEARKQVRAKKVEMRQLDKLIDHCYRGHRETSRVGRFVTNSFYQKAAHHSCFSGCSAGGFSGLMEAHRFPGDWDGIFVVSPSIDPIDPILGGLAWAGIQQGWLGPQAGKQTEQLTLSNLTLMHQSALASCTNDAHAVEGITADPRFCRYDPIVLQCKGKDDKNCLTAKQIDIARNLYAGIKSPSGERIVRGYLPSTERAWDDFLIEKEGKKPWWFGVVKNFHSSLIRC